MAGTRIQAAERPIGDVFSDRYRFSIPRYQRPYSWTDEQAAEMFDDLLGAARCTHQLEEADPYFLGSVVLVKAEGDSHAEVVDGQQRLTTLAILWSVLRLSLPEAFAGPLSNRIFQQGDPIKGTKDQPRLTLRHQDQPFFEKQILDAGSVAELTDASLPALNDTQRNLAGNALLFRRRLAELSEDDCKRLVAFIDRYTYLVVVATEDFDSAYRIFTVLNERGLDLTHTDILKSEIIGGIPKNAQETYTAIWEREEEELGRKDFADLFSHIRMVYAKTKARETILKEFRSTVLARTPDGETFIQNVLVPMSDAFEVVTRSDYRGGDHVDEINNLLFWLQVVDNDDWIPPAISFLSRPGVTPDAVLRFLTDLDRLAASMFVRRVDVTRRIERYGRLLRFMESSADLYATDSPLQLDEDERKETRGRLDGDVYSVIRTRLYVLLRLDHTLSSGGVSYDYPVITVEHVLPQNPKPGSAWRAQFSDAERAAWVHRLANLVLLTRRKNASASNEEFAVKKSRYFTGAGGVSPFVLTTQVLQEETWTTDLLQQRQETLLGKLTTLWRL